MSELLVENALIKAVEKNQDFYQFASTIDQLSKKYLEDEQRRKHFLKELAERLSQHNFPR